MPAGPNSRDEADGDGRGGVGVVGAIETGASVDDVGTAAAGDPVVAAAAEDAVVAAEAVDHVGATKPVDVIRAVGHASVRVEKVGKVRSKHIGHRRVLSR